MKKRSAEVIRKLIASKKEQISKLNKEIGDLSKELSEKESEEFKAFLTSKGLTYDDLYEIIDENVGPANVLHFVKDGKDVLVAANREIDEIANAVGDEKLIREAKYGEKTMNASELALLALRKQSEEREGILKNMGMETEASGAEAVLPTPNSGTKSKEEQALQDVMDGAALIAGIQKGEKA